VIEVIISENGCVLDRLQFDADDILQHKDGIVSVHHGIMRHCSRPEGLWYLVAHAAHWIAETGSALNTLKDGGSRSGASAQLADEPLNTTGQARRSVVIAPPIEINDDDVYRLQRDSGESDADYLARCQMLGCDEQGFIRLPRRA